MSVGDVFRVVEGGGPSIIFLLLLFCGLWLSRRILLPSELSAEQERRREDISYRETIIDRQNTTLERQQALFDKALNTIKTDILPMLERAAERGR